MNPSVLHAQAIPSRSYIGVVANGSATARMLREHDAAAMALAACGAHDGLVHEDGQHRGIGDERERIEEEEGAEALGRDEPARDAAEGASS